MEYIGPILIVFACFFLALAFSRYRDGRRENSKEQKLLLEQTGAVAKKFRVELSAHEDSVGLLKGYLMRTDADLEAMSVTLKHVDEQRKLAAQRRQTQGGARSPGGRSSSSRLSPSATGRPRRPSSGKQPVSSADSDTQTDTQQGFVIAYAVGSSTRQNEKLMFLPQLEKTPEALLALTQELQLAAEVGDQALRDYRWSARYFCLGVVFYLLSHLVPLIVQQVRAHL